MDDVLPDRDQERQRGQHLDPRPGHRRDRGPARRVVRLLGCVGPVTWERGYKDGGAIINGRTEPTGALGGGICSTSTTMFNAALRYGLEMSARQPLLLHRPLPARPRRDGLRERRRVRPDHVVPERHGRAAPDPGLGWKVGTKGYGSRSGRSRPDGRGLLEADREERQAGLDSRRHDQAGAGVKERIEYPVDGKDVWVTRTVKDAAGVVIHQETYYSHYARVTGIVEIGIEPAPPPPAPEPTPEPVPDPTAAPAP